MKCLVLNLLYLISVYTYEVSRKKLFIVHLTEINIKKIISENVKKKLFQIKNEKLQLNSNLKSLSHLSKNKSILVQKKKFYKLASQIKTEYTSNEIARVELMNHGDIQYWGKLQLKKKSGKFQSFNVLFDTGSSWLWLASSECESCAKFNIRNYYNGDEDSQPEGAFKINYGKGSVVGNIIKTSFFLEEKEITNQYFLEIKKMRDMPRMLFDGLIGLGPRHHLDDDVERSRASNSNPANPAKKEANVDRKIMLNLLEKSKGEHLSFLLNLIDAGVIEEPVFSVYLSAKKKNHKNPPSIIFGGYLDELKEEEFKFCSSSNDKGHWSADYNELKLLLPEKEHSIEIKSTRVLIDSGTSMLTFPEEDFNNIMAKLSELDIEAEYINKRKAVYLPKIEDNSLIPSLIYNLCGNEFSLNAEDYSYPEFVEGENGNKIRKGTILKISPLNLNNKLTILGDPFLHKYYVLFDATHNDRKIGIALAKHLKNDLGH